LNTNQSHYWNQRAISRGIVADDTSIANEQFDIIVADLGNFRVQILDENGKFSRQLSLLADIDQVVFQQDQLGMLNGVLLKEYASLQIETPALIGDDMKPLYGLARSLHPSDPAYARISAASYHWRFRRSRYHHPFAVGFAPSERGVAIVDRDNACVHVYNMDGSRCIWRDILPEKDSSEPAVASMHSCLELEFSSDVGVTEERRLYISDSLANRITVVDATHLQVLSLIGASTYGDQHHCSPGYLPGELNHPTFLAAFHDEVLKSAILVVSDSGNHFISLFDARRGDYVGRIGNGFGHAVGYFDSPQGVAVLENRYLYVADQRNHRIQVFILQGDRGRLLRVFGNFGSAPGQFNFPSGIAVCAALPSVPACNFGSHRSCKIAVADTGNCRVQVLDLEGSPQIVISMEQTPFNLPLMPLGVWIEQRSGYLLVCDGANKCVTMFRNDGSFLSSAGVALEPENRFARPISVIVSRRSAGSAENLLNARLLIVDGERKQVCEFELGQLVQ
jgi:DNA-binding beta-propeller fold protein YncE